MFRSVVYAILLCSERVGFEAYRNRWVDRFIGILKSVYWDIE